jgi:hypothetical protein
MRTFLNVQSAWDAIRWKMLTIFAFFSIISMTLAALLAVAVLNVVIRRESAYLIEEWIKVIVDSRKKSPTPCLAAFQSPLAGIALGSLCADVSGKGMSAALMMANLQAVAHGRLLLLDETSSRPAPDAFVTALNRDIRGRFGGKRYATMFLWRV